MTAQIDSIKQSVEETIRTKHPKTVAELFQILREGHPTVTKEKVVDVVKKLKEDGEIELKLPQPRAENYLQYLQARPQNTWFYLVLAASIATLAAVYIIPNTYPAVVFRLIMGSIFVLFLPGFATIKALFPTGKELEAIERGEYEPPQRVKKKGKPSITKAQVESLRRRKKGKERPLRLRPTLPKKPRGRL